jgi:ribosomal protein S18 acetylase RimI-like enzyme
MQQNHDGPASESFPRPPVSFVDDEQRSIGIEAGDDRTALAEMYADFEAEDRAQGIPPVGERRIDRWLETLSEGLSVVGWHGERAVGHAVLMPMDDGRHELSVFVHPDYRGAGIGTRLLRTLFGHGRSHGVETIWLSVQRSNRPARHLYKSVGFETTVSGLEHEMERDL